MSGSTIGSSGTMAKPFAVVNIDDVGMCHGANVAFLELRRLGAVDSGSVMVPCPWFLEIAEIGAEEPSLNLGVHITLNSEKRHYRWRPLTRPTPASGLADLDGLMWRTVLELRRNAHPDAVEAEMRAQIDAFLAAGISATHIDAHMGAAFSPEFVDRYVNLGIEYGLPALFPAVMGSYGPIHNLGAVDESAYPAPAARLSGTGQMLANAVLETPWHREKPARERYETLFEKIGPGFNFVCLHANAPGELEFIEPRSAQIRIDEYELLKDPSFRQWMDERPMQRGSMKDLAKV